MYSVIQQHRFGQKVKAYALGPRGPGFNSCVSLKTYFRTFDACHDFILLVNFRNSYLTNIQERER